MFQIKRRFLGDVLFECELPGNVVTQSEGVKLGFAIKIAVGIGADLDGASLFGANLNGASLSGANLDRTYLSGASLFGANLDGANLSGAILSGAYLFGASLFGANLDGANLSGANLSGANLDGANLDGANLDGANLDSASLVDGGQRSDGYSFVGWIKDNVLQIRAGCRSLSITEARKHWIKTRGGTALGEETMVILDHIERVAKIRGLIVKETTNDA